MSIILLLAAISRCASPVACPSDHDLIAAVEAQDAATAGAVVTTAEMAGEIVMVHPQSVQSIKGVICGDRLPGDLPTVTCTMTVRYRRVHSYQVVKLVQQSGKWQIVDALAVTRRP
jgi:hypothetical protein